MIPRWAVIAPKSVPEMIEEKSPSIMAIGAGDGIWALLLAVREKPGCWSGAFAFAWANEWHT